MSRFLRTGFILLVVLAAASGRSVLAADIRFASEAAAVQPGTEFAVNVLINTTGETINAVEGELTYPVNLLEVVDVQDGDSAITFWLTHPAVTEPGKISFAGITPNGFTGGNEQLVKVLFRASEEGSGQIQLGTTQVLLNDGKGTPTKVTSTPFLFSVAASAAASTTAPVADTEPPEAFTLNVTSDPNIFEGKKFLVFATQDKGSGIDHYEVKEGSLGSYARAESPYVLLNQTLNERIWVKAIDNSGNERIAIWEPETQLTDYQRRALEGAIIAMLAVSALLLLVWAIWKKLRR